MADFIVINKDDGENHINVDIARHMYHSALNIIRRKYPAWQPLVLSCSALENGEFAKFGKPYRPFGR